jgi:hypothetical protein
VIALAAIIALQAGATAAVVPQPTFCERMAQVWPMGSYKNTQGLVRRVRLKGGDGRTVGFEPAPELADTLTPMPSEFCGRSRTGHAGVCHLTGPGAYHVRSKRVSRAFPIYAGEHATVETDGRSIACQDRAGPADYTRFEPLD